MQIPTPEPARSRPTAKPCQLILLSIRHWQVCLANIREQVSIWCRHLFAADEDYAQKSASTKAKTANQRDNLTAFNAAAAVDATKQAIASDDWRELAAGLIMAVQCRPSDMLQAGKFKAVSKYRLAFTTRLKKRGKSVTGEVFC